MPENINASQEEFRLFKWCNQQRNRNKSDEGYPTEYVYLLNSVKFDWRFRNPAEDKVWMDNYNAFMEFINIDGRMPDHGHEGKLYCWYKYNLQRIDFWGPSDTKVGVDAETD